MTSPELTGDVDFALIRQTAHDAYAAGLCVLPASPDGSKRPTVRTWLEYQQARPDEKTMTQMFAVDRHGLGVVCGAVSGNLEMFEFDSAPAEKLFRELAASRGLSPLLECLDRGYSERTPGGGLHWLYRLTEPVAGNTKLASAPDGKTLIETRGEGGWVVVAPSGGKTHPTGRPYKLLAGSMDTIPALTSAEHHDLWNLARSLDQAPVRAESHTSLGTEGPTGDRPGDHFNARATWSDVLSPHGWQSVFQSDLLTYWQRPGKPKGVSATTGLRNAADPTSDLLWVFSTSTAFEASRGYSKFSAYTMLKHGGDFPAAARALAAQGYGGGVAHDASHGDGHRPRTDYGNAERFVAQHGCDLHYLMGARQWMYWDGTRWRPDTTGKVMRMAKDTTRHIYKEAGDEEDKTLRTELGRWAKQSEAQARLDAMITLAESEKGIAVTPDALDADPWLFNVSNGTLDLHTCTLRPHSRDDLITKIAEVAFDENATSEVWEQFLERVLPSPELRTYVQQAVGYSLVGVPSEDVLFFVHGPTRTGKSTFIEAMRSTLGDYARVSDFEAFVKRGNAGGARPEIARLEGARLVVSVEVEDGQELATALVKTLTGGDKVTARQLYKEAFEFTPQFTLWIASNQHPHIPDTDGAMWERVREVPFAVTIPPEERDPQVKRTLANPELSGAAILAWAVRGCLDWQKAGKLQTPMAVLAATANYKANMDPLASFLTACCVLTPDAWTASAALRAEYEGFCRDFSESPVAGRAFANRLTERGLKSCTRGHANTRGWLGIGLLNSREDASAASGTFSNSSIRGEITWELPDLPLAAARSARSEQWERL